MTMKIVEKTVVELIENLRACSVKVTNSNPHWELIDRTKRKKARGYLMRFFRKYGMYSTGYFLKRCCNNKNCYNPFHYCQLQEVGDVSKENLIEIEELTEMINLDELQEMGFKRYLLYFNEDNPIPAKKLDFYLACNRKLRSNGLTPLPKGELDE